MSAPGVPSVDAIISGLKYAWDLYKEARDAKGKFRAAKQVRECLDETLRVLEAHADPTLPSVANAQLAAARSAWQKLNDYLERFESGLSGSEPGSMLLNASKRLRWAISELDRDIDSLYCRIGICLHAAALKETIENRQLLQCIAERISLNTPTSQPIEGSQTDGSDSAAIPLPSDPPSRAIILRSVRSPSQRTCLCRCHSKFSVTPERNRFFFADLSWPSSCETCRDKNACGRRFGVKARWAPWTLSKYGYPYAFTATLDFSCGWLPGVSLAAESVRRYTSPGFVAIARLAEGHHISYNPELCRDFEHLQAHYDAAMWQVVDDFKQRFRSRELSFTDVDPSGKGYLDALLKYPWQPGTRPAQWALVEFLMSESPDHVRNKPSHLMNCASWIGEGRHMDMLDTLLSRGLCPDVLSTSACDAWPQLCSPNRLAPNIAPDPMFIEWTRKCLIIEPEYGDCGPISYALLVGSMQAFQQALDKAKRPIVERNFLGQSPTHLAVCMPRRLRMLLEAGCEPNDIDNGGRTPLMYAACYGQLESVLLLLQHDARLGTVHGRSRRDFIYYAILRNETHVIEGVVRFLRNEGYGQVAAAVLDNAVCDLIMLGRHSSDLNGRDLERLFAMGANADMVLNGSTLLHHAISSTAMRIILRYDFTSVNVADKDGITPLMKHAILGEPAIVSRLLQDGAGPNARDHNGWTAMHHLMQTAPYNPDFGQQWAEGRAEFVGSMHLLLQYGNDVSIRDRCVCECAAGGCSPVTFALHRIADQYGFGHSSVPSFDLLCAIQHRRPEYEEQYRRELTQFRTYLESGAEHTCCRGRLDDFDHRLRDVGVSHLDMPSVCPRPSHQHPDTLITEMAKFYYALESRSRSEYDREVQIRESLPKTLRPSFEVDTDNDRICINIPCDLPLKLWTFEIDSHRTWLQTNLKTHRYCGLPQRGELDMYIHRACNLLDCVEAQLRLLSDDRITEVVELDTVEEPAAT